MSPQIPLPLNVVIIAVAIVSIIALVVGFAVGARRLLGLRVSVVRTLLAGGVAYESSRLFGTALQAAEPQGAFLFVTVEVGVALLSAMLFLVVAEAVAPSGSVRPLAWSRALRHWLARTRRYSQISAIAVRHGLITYLRGRGRLEADAAAGRAQLARSLRLALEEAGVTFVKLGQLLSTRRDLLPAEFVDELGRLQQQVAPAPWQQVEQALVEELGAPTGALFAEFDPTPLAAASIAQVHRARLRSGADVVVKIQRPGIRPVVERDLDIVGRIAGTLQSQAGWARAMGAVDLAQGFAAAVREELDFRIEARNMLAVTAAWAERRADAAVRLPALHGELCTERVLVMERLDGVSLGAAGPVIAARRLDRPTLARTLLSSLLQQVMLDGVFHADPHPGNILLLDDGRLGLLDFGSVGRIDTLLRSALQRLLLAIDHGDPAALGDALLEIVARPEDIDERGLERALGQFMARHLSAGLAPDLKMFTDLFRLMARYGLAVPPEVAAVFRALATLEGALIQLAPGFNIVAESRAFAATELSEQLNPASLRQAASDELLALLPLLRRLPRRADRLTNALEQGRLSLNVRLFADERDRRVVTGLLHQVLLAFLGATSGVMAVMLLGTSGGPSLNPNFTLFQVFGYNLLVLSAVLVLRVLFLIFRPER